MKKFKFTFVCEVELTEDLLWPDGDAPPNPSPADIASLVEQDGGPVQILTDWNLSEGLTMVIKDEETGKTVSIAERD